MEDRPIIPRGALCTVSPGRKNRETPIWDPRRKPPRKLSERANRGEGAAPGNSMRSIPLLA